MKKKIITLLLLIGCLAFATNFTVIKNKLLTVKKTIAAMKTNIENTAYANDNATLKSFPSDIKQGTIGVFSSDDTDETYDNVFHVQIPNLPIQNEQIFLEYDLYGYKSASSVARSINNFPSIGGDFISNKLSWNHQSELLSIKNIRQGDNMILFTASTIENSGYSIKNLKIVYKQNTNKQYFSLYQFENKLYLKGVNANANVVKLTIGGIAVNLDEPEYELIFDANAIKSDIEIVKTNKNGTTNTEKISLNLFEKATKYVAAEKLANTYFKEIKNLTSATILYENFKAEFPKGAVKNATTLSIRGLRVKEVAALNASMVNVTGDYSAYRLLPHGTKFDQNIKIELPFNKKLIPQGYTEKDINVFYFDEDKRTWASINKDSLNLKTNIILARTNHFTDFIAGIIKVPESPETSGNTPTSIKDLKASMPLDGMKTINLPTPNNNGSASTRFEFMLPKGRVGMQPSLALQYDSDNGHSWTGLGWNVAIPSIIIDTRWGAPRYDAAKETESYNLAGQSLLPNSYRQDWIDRTANKQFFLRKEGAFQKIIRMGNAPNNYYWIVTDKSGTTSYYGGNTLGLMTNCVLETATGNIGHWALCLQIDLRGNTVQYEYDKIDGELYPKKIYYTGFAGEKGKYSVTFIKDSDLGETMRADVQQIARLGFKQLNNKLLRKVEMRFKDQMIRSYELTYAQGAFKKTLLKEVAQFDTQGKLFYKNKLNYFNDIQDAAGNYAPFGALQTWSVQNDGITNAKIGNQAGYSNKHSLLASSNGNSSGFNFRLGLGFVFDFGKFKGSTLGGHGGSNSGGSKPVVMLEDIDGDSLPDKVFNDNGTVYYRKNLSGTGQNGFGSAIPLNISSIGYTNSRSFNWGVDLTLSFGPSLNIGFDNQNSRSNTKSYFMDFNHDGLIDFADNGKVLYNRIVAGVPTFIASSTGSPAPVSGGGTLQLTGSTSLILPVDLKAKNPLHDVVRIWEAPVTGIIAVNHVYNLMQDNSPERANYKTNAGVEKADGVHLYFQKSGQLIWNETITGNDYTVKTKLNSNINVTRGDKLYFRVGAIEDGNFDKVSWEPTITYSSVIQYDSVGTNPITSSFVNINPTLTDANNYSLSTYKASSDFFSSTPMETVVPSAGMVSFAGIFTKPVTSDHVILKIYKKLQTNLTVSTVVFERVFKASEVSSFDLSSIAPINVPALCQLKVVLESATNLHWHDVSFNPTITLPSQNGAAPEVKKVEVSHTLYKKRDGNYIIAGQNSTVNGVLDISINPISYPLISTGSIAFDGEIVLSAKQNNKLLARKRYKITAGILSPVANVFDQTYLYETAQVGAPISVEVTASNPASITIFKSYPAGNAVKTDLKTTSSTGAVWNASTTDFALYGPITPLEKELSLVYRNWGGCSINGTLATNTIDESKLKYSNKYADNATTAPDVNNNVNPNTAGYDITDEYFISLTSIYSDNVQQGLEKTIFVQKDLMGTSRLGEDDILEYTDTSLPVLVGGETATLDIVNESRSNSFSAGAGFGPVSGGASTANGSSQVTQTMSDFNGDGFPDYIRGSNVQFTSPMGGLTAQMNNIGKFSNSTTGAQGANVGGTFTHASANNSSQHTTYDEDLKQDILWTEAGTESTRSSTSVSVSGSVSNGNDHSSEIHSDINGDGLADKVTDSGVVSLNSGYGFLPSENWNINKINGGTNNDFSLGLGFSILSGSFYGGGNYSKSESNTKNSFLDINADGLSDKIEYQGSQMLVSFNMGNYFDAPVVYPYFNELNRNRSTSFGLNAGFSIDIPLFFVRIVPSFGVNTSWNSSSSEATLSDINGDGYIDFVQSTGEDNLMVRLSNIGKTNKLKEIVNCTGSTIAINYEQTNPSYNNPNSKWVMSETVVFDGHVGDGVDHHVARFRYENGNKDRRERLFLGFEKIIQEQIDPINNSIYTTTTDEYIVSDIFRKGLIKSSLNMDSSGQLLGSDTYEYKAIDVATQNLISDNLLYNAILDSKSVFIALSHKQSKQFEGTDFLLKDMYFDYDNKGNQTKVTEDIESGDPAKRATSIMTYHESVSPYYSGIAKSHEVYTVDGLKRKSQTTINPNTADVTQIKQYITANKIAITDLEYDQFGNISKQIEPENYRGQRMFNKYKYDSEIFTEVVEIEDAFGYINKSDYDLRFNTKIKTIDRNDQVIEISQDSNGRISKLVAPMEIAAGKPYTILYEYHPEAIIPYSLTKNYSSATNSDIEIFTFADGLERVIQVKKTALNFVNGNNPDQIGFIVSESSSFDSYGRVIAKNYPFFSTKPGNIFDNTTTIAVKTSTLDAKSRVTSETLINGNNSLYKRKISDFNNSRSLESAYTDPNGKTSKLFMNSKGISLGTIINDGNEPQITVFDINAIGEQVSVTNAKGQITSFEFDWLGRKIKEIHPDAGTTTFEYDAAGNLIKKITAELSDIMNNSGIIVSEFDFNRIKEVKYPQNPQNNVRFYYGDQSGTPSRRGRLWLSQDASGGKEVYYGLMGEITKEIKTIRITPTDIQTYVSEFEYDTWNRIQKMTYPDGEIVTYNYNKAGNLTDIKGLKDNKKYEYVKRIGYDIYENNVFVKLGNDTETTKKFDPLTKELTNDKLTNSANETLFDKSYLYNKTGSVISIKNSAAIISGKLGGTSLHQYEYDDLARLKSAKATYDGEYHSASYELEMTYDLLNNITAKNLNHVVDNQQKGYVLSYDYGNEKHPNAPDTISEVGKSQPRKYNYDANGNPLDYSEDQSFRKMTWDEENRLMGINDNGRIHLYTYDYKGERVIKSSGDSQNVTINSATAATIVHADNYTAYVSPYFVVNKGKFTKHFFIGSDRIVTKLGNGTFKQPIGITAGNIDYTKLTGQEQTAMNNYITALGVPPGPPTQLGINASPTVTGNPYPSMDAPQVTENQKPPAGWPKNPVFAAAGDTPGAPVQYGIGTTNLTVKAGYGFQNIGLTENDLFFYHIDHINSTSVITNKNGTIVQHIEYIAFGEILFEEHSTSATMPYLFSSKELDDETNLSYFGGRYYDAKTSLWLNVDPLATKFPNTGAYVYCNNDPINVIDPDGLQSQHQKNGYNLGEGAKILGAGVGLVFLAGSCTVTMPFWVVVGTGASALLAFDQIIASGRNIHANQGKEVYKTGLNFMTTSIVRGGNSMFNFGFSEDEMNGYGGFGEELVKVAIPSGMSAYAGRDFIAKNFGRAQGFFNNAKTTIGVWGFQAKNMAINGGHIAAQMTGKVFYATLNGMQVAKLQAGGIYNGAKGTFYWLKNQAGVIVEHGFEVANKVIKKFK